MKHNIQIVMLGPGLTVQGGISSVIRKYIDAGLGEHVDLVFIPTLEKGGASIRLKTFLQACRKFFTTVIKNPNLIVHIHLSQKGSFVRKFFFFLFARAFNRKTIVHLHGSEFEEFMHSNAVITTLTRFMFDQATIVIVLSNLWNQKLREFTSNKKIITLYNPAQLFKLEQNITSSVIILFMGRLGERKGVFDLLACINKFQSEFRAYRTTFVLAGDGEVDKVRNVVRENKIADLVNVPGWVSGDQRAEYFKSASVLILPSYNEQMPMSILEGMGYGHSIVATNVAGIPEMVSSGINGFLFEPGDIDAMGSSIMNLAKDPNLRAAMGKQSQEILKQKFENSVIINQLVAIYKEAS